jgi:hypothetical protein
MTVLVAGSEGEPFLFTNTLDLTYTDTFRRGSVKLVSPDVLTNDFTVQTDIWVHVRVSPMASQSAGTMQDFIAILDAADVVLCSLRDTTLVDGSTGLTQLHALNTASSTALSTVGPTSAHSGAGDFHVWDIHIALATDTLTVTSYRDGLQVHAHTFTDAGRTWAGPAKLQLKYRSSATDSDDTFFQDVIVSTTPTLGAELVTLTPSAEGNYTAFIGDYTAIDEKGYAPADAVTTSTIAARESWRHGAIPTNILGKTIQSLIISSAAILDTVPVLTSYTPFLRIGGTDYNGANLTADAVSVKHTTTEWTTNPATGSGWNVFDLIALESGVLTA